MEKKKYKFAVEMSPSVSGYKGKISEVFVDDTPIEEIDPETLKFIGASCALMGEGILGRMVKDDATSQGGKRKPQN